ncbi:MAG TPA: hypothetical protein VK711_13725 [Puia sp.]|nr:hypothetical protein [Puia sp.]
MPINKSDIVFIGNAGGICGYMSHGINIIRKSSSLTGKRIKKDPAFKGFRNSGNRMKEASPIAASLYNLLTKDQKVYTLYRTMTGEALKMIKLGLEKEIIIARLKEQYIDPVIDQHLKRVSYKRHVRLKRHLQHSNSIVNRAGNSEVYNSYEVSFQQYLPVNLISQQSAVKRKQKKISQYSELIYIGKYKVCKGLQMWLRPNY